MVRRVPAFDRLQNLQRHFTLWAARRKRALAADHARIAQLERRLGYSAGACVPLALPLPLRSLEDAMDSHECAICRLPLPT